MTSYSYTVYGLARVRDLYALLLGLWLCLSVDVEGIFQVSEVCIHPEQALCMVTEVLCLCEVY